LSKKGRREAITEGKNETPAFPKKERKKSGCFQRFAKNLSEGERGKEKGASR